MADALSRWLTIGSGSGSGPRVAWLFQRALAAVHLCAFYALARQVPGLIGSRGLLPWAPLAALLREREVPFHLFPSVLRFATGDGALLTLAWLGVALALAALVGLFPRALFAVLGVLYLGFVLAGRDFFSFQWDSLLIECSWLAALLPTDRPRRWVHLLFRILLFKVYFESGVAKWFGGPEWHAGTAMGLYYETAPLPTWLAWHVHHAPAWYHAFETYAALVLELLIPLFIFGPLLLRRVAFVAFSGFQVLDILTANYGFFCYLSLALGLFLLDDTDLPARIRRPFDAPSRWERAAIIVPIVAIYVGLSAIGALDSLTPVELPSPLERIHRITAPFEAVNVFHLFASITPERIEPIFETAQDGKWTPLELKHKAGDPQRAPDFVAPYQPRLDFQLWFYGLSPGRTPAYVANLLERLCADPAAVQPFFATPLPTKPDAVRVRFARYHFTSREERRAGLGWWKVEPVGDGPALNCGTERP